MGSGQQWQQRCHEPCRASATPLSSVSAVILDALKTSTRVHTLRMKDASSVWAAADLQGVRRKLTSLPLDDMAAEHNFLQNGRPFVWAPCRCVRSTRSCLPSQQKLVQIECLFPDRRRGSAKCCDGRCGTHARQHERQMLSLELIQSVYGPQFPILNAFFPQPTCSRLPAFLQ